MYEDLHLAFHEIDFIVPVHRFNIQYSYVTKERLSFIREFVLRIVQLSPLKPNQIATYLGLNKEELNEALSDLMSTGDLQISESGDILLTPQSEDYFEDLGKLPKTSSIMETSSILSFEIGGFNCLGSRRIRDNWKFGIALNVDNEIIANSANHAKTTFQRKFYQYYDKEWLKGVKSDSNEKPTIYSFDSVNKLGQDSLRLTNLFKIDLEGNPLERDDYESLENSNEVNKLVTKALSIEGSRTNIPEVAEAMKSIGDNWTVQFFNSSSIDVPAFTAKRAESEVNPKIPLPLVGPAYSKENWRLILESIKKANEVSKKSNNPKVSRLTWIAPSDKYWGKSSRLTTVIDDLKNFAHTRSKKPQKMYEAEIFLPVPDTNDKQAIRRWLNDFGKESALIKGLSEGFLNGCVEVIFMEDQFVTVLYHLAKPDLLPVTMPVGFISKDKSIVRKIQSLANDYVDGMKSFDQPNNFGALAQV
jgi:hypothetical protein